MAYLKSFTMKKFVVSKTIKYCLTICNMIHKWLDKSTTSYDMLDFKSNIKSLTRKYLANPRHTFATFRVELADMSITNFLFNF